MDSNFHPLVSIVIPVYNGSNYLAEAIDSALAQTYDNIEILVINDGSSDDGATEKIVLSYGDRLRYFKKENGGVSSALNLGIREMRGEYFSWLSHDDKYLPEKIERQIAFLKRIGRDDVILYGNFFFMDRDSRITGRTRFKNISPTEFRCHLLIDYIANGCTMLIPRQCFEKSALFREDLRITQDIERWFRFSYVYDFMFVAGSLVCHRTHPAQGSYRLNAYFYEKDLLYRSILNALYDESGNEHIASRQRKFLLFARTLLRMALYKPSLYAFRLFRLLQRKERRLPAYRHCFLRWRYTKALHRYRKEKGYDI